MNEEGFFKLILQKKNTLKRNRNYPIIIISYEIQLKIPNFCLHNTNVKEPRPLEQFQGILMFKLKNKKN